jgi:nucleotide-binding universal stress UspA family protein
MQRFKNILFIADGPNLQGPALQRAVSLAAANGASLTVGDVLSLKHTKNLPMVLAETEKLENILIEERRGRIEALVQDLQHNTAVSVKVFVGKPYYEIIRSVLRYGFDLVIKQPDTKKTLATSLFGSLDMHLLRKCPCPVWIVKPETTPKIKRILAAVDLESYGDDDELYGLNRQILEMTTSLAWSEAGELHIVHAWMVMGQMMLDFPWAKYLKNDVQTWMAAQKEVLWAQKDTFDALLDSILKDKGLDGLSPQIHMIEGDAEEVIPAMVTEKEIDLLIMGTISRTDLAGIFIGSTAETVLSRVNCSVLAVKPSGFFSPITMEA